MNLKSAPATILLGSLGMLLLVAIAWVGLIGPALDDRSAAAESRTESLDRTQAMRLQLATLRKQAEDLPTTDELAADLDTVFPATADQPGFFAQVSVITDRTGISPEDVTLLSPGVPTVAGADPNATPDPAAAAAAAASVSSVAVQSVTVAVTGDYYQMTEVLRGLEQMPRAFLVSSIDLSADQESGSMTLNVVGSTFVAPPLQDEAS